MNVKSLIASVALATIGQTAFAQEVLPEPPTQYIGASTRTEAVDGSRSTLVTRGEATVEAQPARSERSRVQETVEPREAQWLNRQLGGEVTAVN